MEWFQKALARARELLEKNAREYPLVDDDELIDEEVIYNCWPWQCHIGSIMTGMSYWKTPLPAIKVILQFILSG
jgi:hypothetical protein